MSPAHLIRGSGFKSDQLRVKEGNLRKEANLHIMGQGTGAGRKGADFYGTRCLYSVLGPLFSKII